MTMLDLKNLTRGELRAELGARGVEKYRGDQVFRWVHGRDASGFAAMTDVGRALRDRLAAEAAIHSLAVDAEQVSVDGTRKLRLRTGDGRFIESVLIPDGDAGSDGDEPDDNNEPATAADVEGPAMGEFDGGRRKRVLIKIIGG